MSRQPESKKSSIEETCQIVSFYFCGQELQASWQRNEGLLSLATLKETVERATGIEQDWIQFCDGDGSTLLSDEELSHAINNGRAPINALVLSDQVLDFGMLWKIMRDQVRILSLQLGSSQQQLKNVQQGILSKDQEHAKQMMVMKNQLALCLGGLEDAEEGKTSWTKMDERVSEIHGNVKSMGLNLEALKREEALKKETIAKDVQFTLEAQIKDYKRETTKLAEAFDACLSLLQQTDGQLGKDVLALQKNMEETRNWIAKLDPKQAEEMWATQHAQTGAPARPDCAAASPDTTLSLSLNSLEECSSVLLKQAQKDAANQLDVLAVTIGKFETRLCQSESVLSDAESRWSASHEQLKQQYDSVSQAVEHCRLQNQASTQEVREELRVQAEGVKAQATLCTSVKMEQERHREQLKNMHQTIELESWKQHGALRKHLDELEEKLSDCIDREAEKSLTHCRIASIRRALEEVGASADLRNEISSKICREEKAAQQKKAENPAMTSAVARTSVEKLEEKAAQWKKAENPAMTSAVARTSAVESEHSIQNSANGNQEERHSSLAQVQEATQASKDQQIEASKATNGKTAFVIGIQNFANVNANSLSKVGDESHEKKNSANGNANGLSKVCPRLEMNRPQGQTSSDSVEGDGGRRTPPQSPPPVCPRSVSQYRAVVSPRTSHQQLTQALSQHSDTKNTSHQQLISPRSTSPLLITSSTPNSFQWQPRVFSSPRRNLESTRGGSLSLFSAVRGKGRGLEGNRGSDQRPTISAWQAAVTSPSRDTDKHQILFRSISPNRAIPPFPIMN